MLAENSLFSAVGKLFHPLFVAVADVLAFIYAIIPNYAIAIILLTIIIMAILTPLTIKSTKSMIAMQTLQPEMQRLRQKYKGAENREQLNQEMMKLYKEQGVSPTGGCLPMFLQMPALVVLYDVIKGLTNTIPKGSKYPSGTQYAGQVCHQALCGIPRYIPQTSTMYHHLVATPGQMVAFGINLALKPFSHHGSWYAYIPYFTLVVIAVALQYLQMSQMTKRNPAAAKANPQMQTMQKVMPLIFAYIYFIIPAGVVLYMIVSTAIRIGTQDFIFRHGIVKRPAEREIGGGAKKAGGAKVAGAAALVKGDEPPSNGNGRPTDPSAEDPPKGAAAKKTTAGSPGKAAPKAGGGTKSSNGAGGSGRSSGGAKPTGRSGGSNGSEETSEDDGDQGTAPKAHPRSKSKRTRRDR